PPYRRYRDRGPYRDYRDGGTLRDYLGQIPFVGEEPWSTPTTPNSHLYVGVQPGLLPSN
ncbi:MAG: hypothetical protein HOQ24_11050, partial [Mycobacteriaceae bacterium]|nr:hypothetical protein [Mycobacteriaceae bacterium]